MNKKDICKKILETYGTSKQMEQTKEELLELGLALRHFATGKVGMKEVITEIADVKIMAEQMAIAFGEETVEEEVERKLRRQLDRIANRDANAK